MALKALLNSRHCLPYIQFVVYVVFDYINASVHLITQVQLLLVTVGSTF